jgi:hypothetical protein
MDDYEPAGSSPPVKDPTAFELLRALQEKPSCPVCQLTLLKVEKYMDALVYESVNDIAVRERLRRSLGWCAPHGRQWLRQGDALGTALIYNDIFTQVQKTLESFAGDSGSEASTGTPKQGLVGRLQTMLGRNGGSSVGQALADALEPSGPCPACRQSAEVEQRLLASCAGALEHPDFAAAYSKHPTGLCLPHLRSVLRMVPGDPAALALASVHAAISRATRSQLEEVIRKSDYRYSAEPAGDEFTVPPRSVEQAGGLLPNQINRDIPSS